MQLVGGSVLDSRAAGAGLLVQGCRLRVEVGRAGRNAERWVLPLPRALGTGRLKMEGRGRNSGRSRDAGRRGQGPWERREAPNPARPPVCELHVHPDCVPFACSDCRQCHQDGHRDHVSEQGPGWGWGWGWEGQVEPADGPSAGHASAPLAGGEPALQRALRGLPEGVRLLGCAGRPALRVVRHPGGVGCGLVRGGGAPFCRSPSVWCPFRVGIPIVQKRVGAPSGRGRAV